MSKKSRKARAKSRAFEGAGRPAIVQPQAGSAPVARVTQRQSAASAAFTPAPVSYNYVKSDLVRIGIIAGALIIVIIVLTFIPGIS